MKALMCLFGMVSLAVASVPRGSFPGADYEAARAKAKESGKQIAVVVTDTSSNCPKCVTGNEAVFKEMRSSYVLVVKDKARNDTLPGDIERKTHEIYQKKGNIIPIVTVLSPESDRVLGGLSYKQIGADTRKAFRTLKTEIAEALQQADDEPAKVAQNNDEAPATPANPEADTAEACATGGLRDWTNAAGRTIRAEALSVDKDNVVFKMENGRVVNYPLDQLSEESREEAVKACGGN